MQQGDRLCLASTARHERIRSKELFGPEESVERKDFFQLDVKAILQECRERANSETLWLAEKLGCMPGELMSMSISEYDELLIYHLGVAKRQREAYEEKKNKNV